MVPTLVGSGRTSELFHGRLKDRNAALVVVRLNLSMLLCFCACASSIFESLSVLFFVKVGHVHIQVDGFVQVGKRARRGSIVVLVAAFVGGRRCVRWVCDCAALVGRVVRLDLIA